MIQPRELKAVADHRMVHSYIEKVLLPPPPVPRCSWGCCPLPVVLSFRQAHACEAHSRWLWVAAQNDVRLRDRPGRGCYGVRCPEHAL